VLLADFAPDEGGLAHGGLGLVAVGLVGYGYGRSLRSLAGFRKAIATLPILAMGDVPPAVETLGGGDGVNSTLSS
jgi:hypothetical protein